VPPPDEKSREQILSIELRKMPTTFKLPTPTAAAAAKSSTGNGHSSSNDSQETAQLPEDDLVFFEELVRSTAGFSGAEVVASVQEAAMLAVDRGDDAVDRYHIREAIAAIKPQITKDMLRFYEALAAQY
jgi:SpoVK/Ycf46/Vps4 family AAA+-type ATPase